MRWSIIRQIWLRDLRDQLRDRRTIIMIVGLPLFLYPALGLVVMQFARGFVERPSTVGVVAGPDKSFPPRDPPAAGRSPVPVAAGFAAASAADTASLLGAVAFVEASRQSFDYPLLVHDGTLLIPEIKEKVGRLTLPVGMLRVQLVFLDEADQTWLDEKRVDVILSAPADFFSQLDRAGDATHALRPALKVLTRPEDDHSRLALRRLTPVLDRWKHDLKRVRLARKGLPERYLDPFEIDEPNAPPGGGAQVVDLITRVFPFMLVMWSLAGALYPAVDLCAGEKERGTMETLLITPAGREEIVVGKFLTIWMFSAGTALLNLVSMGLASTQFASAMPGGGLSWAALVWCVFLLLPLSALFSAISLAIGAYARSTKEGQYYLMPLFVLTMPLIFLTLAPGVELNPFYSLVPVTGVALLMQKLMASPSLDAVPWQYFVPVLAPVALYSWLALRWAIEQFQREEVLFREAERLDIKLWVQSLLREKEPLPTAGQAFFAFALIIVLRWVSLGLGGSWSLEVHTAITQIAFVAAPPLFMALLLNTRPRDALYLRAPSGREVGLAALLALLLLPPLTGLAETVSTWFPNLMEGRHPLVTILRSLNDGLDLPADALVPYLLAYALLPAVCEEIAFRGFILTGLHRRFRPRNAVLLSSLMFALYHLNVFLTLPTLCLGVVLGLLTVRSRSLLPAIAFHGLHNSVLILSIPLSTWADDHFPGVLQAWAPAMAAASAAVAGGVLWWLYRKPYVDLERAERHTPAIGPPADTAAPVPGQGKDSF